MSSLAKSKLERATETSCSNAATRWRASSSCCSSSCVRCLCASSNADVSSRCCRAACSRSLPRLRSAWTTSTWAADDDDTERPATATANADAFLGVSMRAAQCKLFSHMRRSCSRDALKSCTAGSNASPAVPSALVLASVSAADGPVAAAGDTGVALASAAHGDVQVERSIVETEPGGPYPAVVSAAAIGGVGLLPPTLASELMSASTSAPDPDPEPEPDPDPVADPHARSVSDSHPEPE